MVDELNFDDEARPEEDGPCVGCDLRDPDRACEKVCDQYFSYMAGDSDEEWKAEGLPTQLKIHLAIKEDGKDEGPATAEGSTGTSPDMSLDSQVPAASSSLAGTTPATRNREKEKKPVEEKKCKVPGCDNPVKCRGFCLKCYDLWRHGTLPGFPPYERILKRTKKAKKAKPDKNKQTQTPASQPAAPAGKTCDEPGCDQPVKAKGKCNKCYMALRRANGFQDVVIDLGPHPEMRDMVFQTALKMYVNPAHVIISLIGEALSRRRSETE